MTDTKLQTLMTAAYSRYTKNMSKEDFHDQLSSDERTAVFAGNMNYQIENGGFMQWQENGYAKPEVVSFLKRLTKRVGTEAATTVYNLLEKFEAADFDFSGRGGWDAPEFDEDAYELVQESLDKIDGEFYAVNTKWLADLEATFS